MNGEGHGRARRLVEVFAVEGIAQEERAWLDAHLEQCAGCAAYATSIEQTVSTLRTVSFAVDPTLVAETRKRVHLRAHQIREHEARMRALWVSCALSWGLGVVSAPLLWWGLKWIGQQLAVPQPVWVVAFALSWMVPAAAVLAGLAWRRSRALNQNAHDVDLGHLEC